MLPHTQAMSTDHGGPRQPTFRLRGRDVTTSPPLPKEDHIDRGKNYSSVNYMSYASCVVRTINSQERGK